MATTNYNEASNRANEAMDNAKKAASAGYEGAKESAKDTADKLSNKVADVADTVSDYAKKGAEKLEGVTEQLKSGSSDAYKTMIETVQKHPMASLAAAAVAGAVLLGILRD